MDKGVFPEMGVPLVIIHFERWDFPEQTTIHKWGTPKKKDISKSTINDHVQWQTVSLPEGDAEKTLQTENFCEDHPDY